MGGFNRTRDPAPALGELIVLREMEFVHTETGKATNELSQETKPTNRIKVNAFRKHGREPQQASRTFGIWLEQVE